MVPLAIMENVTRSLTLLIRKKTASLFVLELVFSEILFTQ